MIVLSSTEKYSTVKAPPYTYANAVVTQTGSKKMGADIINCCSHYHVKIFTTNWLP